jgi:alpha-tubulin suppressor-like RCC1 family protein
LKSLLTRGFILMCLLVIMLLSSCSGNGDAVPEELEEDRQYLEDLEEHVEITEDIKDLGDTDEQLEDIFTATEPLEPGLLLAFGSNEYGQLGQVVTANMLRPQIINGLPKVKAVSAGYDHSLLLMFNGDVYSFGQGEFGQLGHGDYKDKFYPTKIEGLARAKAIAASANYSLVLLENGDIYSFGSNDYGRLGHEQQGNYYLPVKIENLAQAKAIAAGGGHALILLENGDVYSMGFAIGCPELSHGGPESFPFEDHWTPRKIEEIGRARAVSASSTHSLIITEDGTTLSFGYPYGGQLGREFAFNFQPHDKPAPVENLTNAREAAAGSHYSLFLLQNGSVSSCGYDWGGRLGLGKFDDSWHSIETPQIITGVPAIKAISAGTSHSLILTVSGEVYSFGSGSLLRLDNSEDQYTPRKIDDLGKIEAISAGGTHSLLLSENGEVYSFGIGSYGQLGQGKKGIYDRPTAVKDLNNALMASGGYDHTLVLLENGQVCSFGANEYGQLGHESTSERSLPTVIEGLSDIRSVAAGGKYSLVLSNSGAAYSFGFGGSGQLGNLFDFDDDLPESWWRSSPQKIDSLSDVRAVAAGYSHSYFALKNGDVYYCGGGYWEGETYKPEKVENLNRVIAITPGSINNILALHNNGDVYTNNWHISYKGDLLGLNNGLAVAAGSEHALVLLSSGEVLSFGGGREGQLGHGNNDDLERPTVIKGISDAIAIAAGEYHSLVLLKNGEVLSFGRGREGQLGHGQHSNVNVPTKIEGLTGIIGIAAGNYHSLMIQNVDSSAQE